MQVEIDEGIRSMLVVEDEMLVAMLMEDLLRSMGVEDVHICADAASALDVLGKTAVDCAVLDLLVRDGSTIAVADELEARGIPFVFSSGSDVGALEARHAARPMISKPFLDDDFKLVVLDTWTLSRGGTQAGAQSAERASASD